MTILEDIESIIAEIEEKKGLEPWLDTIWFIDSLWALRKLQSFLEPYRVKYEEYLTFAGCGFSIKAEEDDPPEEISARGIYLELCDGTFRQLEPSVLFGEEDLLGSHKFLHPSEEYELTWDVIPSPNDLR